MNTITWVKQSYDVSIYIYIYIYIFSQPANNDWQQTQNK